MLHEASIYKQSDWHSEAIYEEKNDKVFMEVNIDLKPYKRPFLLSRDLVFARPSGSKDEPFEVSFFYFHYKKKIKTMYQLRQFIT